MTKNEIHITMENLEEWLCSTGYLFPRNPLELKRYNNLYPKVKRTIPNEVVDPDAIFEGTRKEKTFKSNIENQNKNDFTKPRMAARNMKDLPDHILKKINNNQDSNGKKSD